MPPKQPQKIEKISASINNKNKMKTIGKRTSERRALGVSNSEPTAHPTFLAVDEFQRLKQRAKVKYKLCYKFIEDNLT